MSDMTRISIPVTVIERETLRQHAMQELRDPRDHARYLLRLALGLTPDAKPFENANRAGEVLPDPSAVIA
jgi:hypothetical protein